MRLDLIGLVAVLILSHFVIKTLFFKKKEKLYIAYGIILVQNQIHFMRVNNLVELNLLLQTRPRQLHFVHFSSQQSVIEKLNI